MAKLPKHVIRDGNVVSLREEISNLLNSGGGSSEDQAEPPIMITSSRANSEEDVQSTNPSNKAKHLASFRTTTTTANTASTAPNSTAEDQAVLQGTVVAPRRNTVLRIMGPKNKEYVLKMKSDQTIAEVRKLLQPHLNKALMVIGHSSINTAKQQHNDYDLRTAVQPPQLSYEPYMTLEECGLVPGARMHLVFRNKK